MIRSTSALVLIVCGGLALVACGSKEEGGATTGAAASAAPPATAAATATATATAEPTASAAPAETASAAPEASGSAAPADSAAPANTPTAAPSLPIEPCCAALDRVKGSGRSKGAKKKASQAATVCHKVAPLVRAGRSTRAQALTQVRSALTGSDVPPSCR